VSMCVYVCVRVCVSVSVCFKGEVSRLRDSKIFQASKE